MNLTLPFAELPLSRLCAAGMAFSICKAIQGAVLEGTLPGAPVRRKSSA